MMMHCYTPTNLQSHECSRIIMCINDSEQPQMMFEYGMFPIKIHQDKFCMDSQRKEGNKVALLLISTAVFALPTCLSTTLAPLCCAEMLIVWSTLAGQQINYLTGVSITVAHFMLKSRFYILQTRVIN
jgi:hypothetical protein